MGIKILFSPSESKRCGGDNLPLSADGLSFINLYNIRKEAIDIYNEFVNSATNEQLTKMFGLKDSEKFAHYKADIYKQQTTQAVARYDGVAFEYLDYGTLNNQSREYIDNNVIIFSNLFGPILAKDLIPDYRLKQNEKINNFATDEFYKKHFSHILNETLQNEFCIDLRAEFYNKFYKPNFAHITLKFLKNSKVVSHFAKAYRGIVLRNLAINQINSLDEFMQMPIKGLSIKEILQKKLHTEIVFEIMS